MAKILRFVSPSWSRLTVFALLALIAWSGETLSWAFSKSPWGPPKPPLYDVFDRLDPSGISWLLYAFILLPLWPVSKHICHIAFFALVAVYLYCFSCAIVGISTWLAQKIKGRLRTIT